MAGRLRISRGGKGEGGAAYDGPMPKPSSSSIPHPGRKGRVPAVAIVVSRYNGSITDRLREGALEAYGERGGEIGNARVIVAPGAYELPALALAAAKTGKFRGVLGLGCLIKGETSHDRYIADAVANGLVNVTIATGVPCAFGVLTVDTAEQAAARAGGKLGNKGEESMHALLDTIEQMDELKKEDGAVRVIRNGTAPGFGRRVPDKALARRSAGGKR